MGITVDGPIIEYEELGWGAVLAVFGSILAVVVTSSIGASVQKSSVAGGEAVAIADQLVGKVGPMIGKWDPEKSNRMIQEF